MVSLFTSILITPGKGWEAAYNSKQPKREVMLKYALPLIIITGICSIIGSFITTGNMVWGLGIKRMVVMIISLFAGIYLSAFCIRIAFSALLNRAFQFSDALIFTIYSFTCVFAVLILDELFEEIFFIDIFYLYTFYIVHEGCIKFLQLQESKSDKKSFFVLIASAAIILWPIVVRKFLLFAMPGLN